MTTTYERYLKLNLDSSCIGLGHGESESNYFCTPKGAKVISWAGMDGIHYCFVRGFGEMVFAVSPTNTPENYVHPIANDFVDFLRLILACGDAAALEQVYCWDQVRFDIFLQDNTPTATQQSVLDTIREKLLLTPMEEPFAYIKELQAKFDYNRVKYTEDYYEHVPAEPKKPEWKVYFDDNFRRHHGRERAGKEIHLDKQFIWDDEAWHIPAIYTCSKGLVLDFCVRVPIERIRSFIDTWHLSVKNDGSNLTDEQRMQIDAENPLSFKTNPQVVLNGTVLSGSHSRGVPWNPCFPEGNGLEAKSAIQHYCLDSACGWVIWRAAFPWAEKHKPQIAALSVTLKQKPVALPGPHFHVPAPGECIAFTHPTTGAQHMLTIQEYAQREMAYKYFESQDYDFPTHYTVMSYTLSPDLPDSAFTVIDCIRSDQPRQKSTNPYEPQTTDSISVGIIGGADGATAISFGGSGQGQPRTACSALHFKAVDDVEWYMVFHEKKREDVTVELI